MGCFLLLAIEKNVAIKVGREDYLFSKHKSVPVTLHSLQVLQSFMLRIKSLFPVGSPCGLSSLSSPGSSSNSLLLFLNFLAMP